MTDRANIFAVIANEAIMGVAVFYHDGGRCIYLNRIAREFLEIASSDQEENPDLNVSELIPSADRPEMRALSFDMMASEGFHHEVLMTKKNGHGMVANVCIKHSRIENGEVPVVLLMFQDITIQKKLQREVLAKQAEINKAYGELLEQNNQLKELDRAKDRFIALTTHELRTPLAAIIATSEVLDLQLYETEEERIQFIRTIHEQGLHLMELVNDILDFAKIRAGKMEFFVENVDLSPLVERLLSNFQNMALQSKVTIEFKKSETPMMAWFDILRMKEVVNNVVNNAIKYNREGGRVMVSMETIDQTIRIIVADTGRGIPAESIASVFNEFETVGQVAKHHKGTGLGMPISKQLIEKMGGRLSLESTVDVGTTFFIDIPTEKVLPPEMYNTRPDAWADLAAA